MALPAMVAVAGHLPTQDRVHRELLKAGQFLNGDGEHRPDGCRLAVGTKRKQGDSDHRARFLLRLEDTAAERYRPAFRSGRS